MRIVERWLDLPGSTRELLSRHRWDFASRNHDDDFHTDVLFLRVSCGSMASFAGHASRSVLSYHDGFDARFFYEEQENRGVIARLVERYFGDRPWRESIPGAIREAAARLDAVLSPLRTPEALRRLSLSELRAVYAAQHEAHLKLYEPCWTAEALQAAGKGLTEALIRLLLEKNVSRETLFEIFNTLTATDAPSIFGAEQERLVRAAMAIADDPALKALVTAHPARAKLYFDAPVLRLAREVSASSGVFAYHGFSLRRRASEDDILERLVELVVDDARRERERRLIERREASLEERSWLAREIGLDDDGISLFRTYAELGNTKVLRRMVQLHNFEFLDAMLRELAIRLDTCEAVFRFMTPEEVLGCFDRGRVDDEAHYRQRAAAMTFVIHDGEEFLLVGEASLACREAVVEVPIGAGGQLAGVPVSRAARGDGPCWRSAMTSRSASAPRRRRAGQRRDRPGPGAGDAEGVGDRDRSGRHHVARGDHRARARRSLRHRRGGRDGHHSGRGSPGRRCLARDGGDHRFRRTWHRGSPAPPARPGSLARNRSNRTQGGSAAPVAAGGPSGTGWFSGDRLRQRRSARAGRGDRGRAGVPGGGRCGRALGGAQLGDLRGRRRSIPRRPFHHPARRGDRGRGAGDRRDPA